MEKYIEQIREVARALSALNEGLHALGDLGSYTDTLITVADAIEQQRPAEEISNVELIGLIALMLAKIEARDDVDTSTMEQVYEDVLKRYKAKSKGV